MPFAVKIKRLAVSAVAFGVVAGAAMTSTEASAQQNVRVINCPTNVLEREVVTRLPGRWEARPMRGRLVDTRVNRRGGQIRLICDYGRAGVVRRLAPRRARNCQARGNRFRCVVGNQRPVTHSTAALNIRQTFLADLDRGRVIQNGADIWFEAKNPRRKFITPVNGARISYIDGRQRGFRGCSTARYSRTPVRLNRRLVGSYICVKTDRGRISELRVNALQGAPLSSQTLRIGYTTWKKR